jgi:hypothetical protein
MTAWHSIVLRRRVAANRLNTPRGFGHLLAQPLDFAQQRVDLLLLTDDDLVSLVQQVLIEAGLDFQLGQAVVCGVVGFSEVAPVWTERPCTGTGRTAGVLYNFFVCQKDSTCLPFVC